MTVFTTCSFIITHECNLSCTYCFIKQRQGTITKEIIEKTKLFLKKSPLALKYVTLMAWGGEPFLYIDILTHIKRSFPKNTLAISTNGTLVSKKILDFLN